MERVKEVGGNLKFLAEGTRGPCKAMEDTQYVRK